jgi:hypothetical protein
MKTEKPLYVGLVILLVLAVIPPPASWGATGLAISGVFLGEPDVFVPGVGMEAKLGLAHSLGLAVGAASFLSGTWGMEIDLVWHISSGLSLSAGALLLFDIVDGFVPQLSTGLRFSFPLSRSLAFFNEFTLNVPLSARFLQPEYAAGLSLAF